MGTEPPLHKSQSVRKRNTLPSIVRNRFSQSSDVDMQMRNMCTFMLAHALSLRTYAPSLNPSGPVNPCQSSAEILKRTVVMRMEMLNFSRQRCSHCFVMRGHASSDQPCSKRMSRKYLAWCINSPLSARLVRCSISSVYHWRNSQSKHAIFVLRMGVVRARLLRVVLSQPAPRSVSLPCLVAEHHHLYALDNRRAFSSVYFMLSAWQTTRHLRKPSSVCAYRQRKKPTIFKFTEQQKRLKGTSPPNIQTKTPTLKYKSRHVVNDMAQCEATSRHV